MSCLIKFIRDEYERLIFKQIQNRNSAHVRTKVYLCVAFLTQYISHSYTIFTKVPRARIVSGWREIGEIMYAGMKLTSLSPLSRLPCTGSVHPTRNTWQYDKRHDMVLIKPSPDLTQNGWSVRGISLRDLPWPAYVVEGRLLRAGRKYGAASDRYRKMHRRSIEDVASPRVYERMCMWFSMVDERFQLFHYRYYRLIHLSYCSCT